MFEEHNLDYLDEVKAADVDGLFFVDCTLRDPNPRWVRSPFMDTRDIAIIFATHDPSEISDIRIQSMKDLIVPVNADGISENDCQSASIPFEPLCQRVEWIFGSAYRIDKDSLKWAKEEKKHAGFKKGLYFPFLFPYNRALILKWSDMHKLTHFFASAGERSDSEGD